MPLHPQAQAVIDGMGSRRQINPATMSPQAAREVMDAQLMALRAPAPEVGKVEDRRIDTPGGPLPIRIYWPLGDATPGGLPIYLYLHSGGYVAYNIETADPQCRILANAANCIVISVGYRLAPEARFPAPVEDCFAATQWAARHAAAIGGDAERLAIGGESCGGTMASVVSILARDAGGPAIRCVVMCCPLTDLKEPPLDSEMGEIAAWFRNLYIRAPEDALDFRASPQLADDVGGLPPTLVLTAEYDGLLAQGEAYAEKLRQAGVSVDYACFEGMIHNFTGMGGALDTAQEGLDLIAGRLRKAFA